MALFIAVITLVTLFLFLVAIYFHFRSLKEVSLVPNSGSEINVEELAEKIVDRLLHYLAEESTRQGVIAQLQQSKENWTKRPEGSPRR